MAIEDLKSTTITNRDATPSVAPSAGQGAPGRVRSVAESITPAAAQSDTSTNRLFRVPSNAVPLALNVWAADMSAGKWAFGLLDLDGNVIDDNHLGHADFGEGPFIGTNMLYRDSAGGVAGTVGIADMNKPLWQTLGLTADPHVEYIVYGRCFENFSDATAIRVELVYAV